MQDAAVMDDTLASFDDHHGDPQHAASLPHLGLHRITITRPLRMTFVAKYFERIGDQATNISEQVVYMTEARVIKHKAEGRGDEL